MPEQGKLQKVQAGGLGLTMLFGSLSVTVFNGSLPLYLQAHRFSVQAIGVLVGVSFGAQLVATPLVGPLVDRRGARLPLRAGTALFVAAAALYLLSADRAVLALARVLQGVGFALLIPAAYALAPSLVPTRMRGMAIGGLGAFINVALAAGAPLGLWLLHGSASRLFLVAGGAAVGGLAASLVIARTPPVARTRSTLFAYDRRWTPLLLVTFLTVVYFGVLSAFLPLHVPASQVSSVGAFFAADALAVLAFRIPAGHLTDSHGPKWLLLSGIAVTVVGIALLFAPPSLPLVVLAGVGTGAGAALLLPPIIIELSKRSDPGNTGSAMALYATSFAAAIAVGSVAAAPLVAHAGFEFALVVSTIACVLAAPVVLLTTPGGAEAPLAIE
ncbi:MAG: MFS transporter [Candidatus Dormibacteraeota bacterium]|nr:MFS transporter [Candidatus Dormibacteraeota bacterium]